MIFPKLFKKAHARNSRGGHTTYVTGDPGNYKFHDKPQFDDHEPSSHLMADNNVDEAYPSIYRDKDGNWSNQSYDQAKQRKEVYKFHGKRANERMINFARRGNWKK
jgi:major membrane immunogen (membrane-anchored lipoprotein)